MSAHEPPYDLLVDLVFGVLDNEQAGRLERHLASCASCARESAQLAATVEELAYAVPLRRAPAALRAAVLERVRTDERRRRRVAPSSGAWRRALVPVLSASCVALAVALGVVSQRAAEPRPGAVTVVALQTGEELAGAHVRLLLDSEQAFLLVRDLPDPPAGMVWQLWRYDERHRMRSLLVLEHGGASMLVRAGSLRLGQVAGFVVTMEHGRGSAEPSGHEVASAELL